MMVAREAQAAVWEPMAQWLLRFAAPPKPRRRRRAH